jgi:hypothetical protein
VLEASHAKSLEHQAWMFPISQYRHLHATHGNASIRNVDKWWIVTAGDCKQLTVELEAVSN